jgi:long-chain fatty acid transport protein
MDRTGGFRTVFGFSIPVLLACWPGSAQAGSFHVREQSARGMGQAYAGVAAGSGGLSSMFWNPATMTQAPGIQSSLIATRIIPYANLAPTAGTLPALLPLGGAGNISPSALVPALYGSYQITDDLWAGLAVNVPYGLGSKPRVPTASQLYGLKSGIKSVEITPMLAYRFNEMLSVGIGVRFMRLSLQQQTALAPIPTPPVLAMRTNGWGTGFRIGAMFRPFAGTTIGLAYNSRIDIATTGAMSLPIPLFAIPAGVYNVGFKLVTPDSVNIGIRQKVGDNFALTGTFEWTNWSRLKSVPITGSPIPGQSAPFFYRDGWLAALGGEYRWNDRLTLRAGISYEQSPLTTRIREVRNVDRDRKLLTAGLTYSFSEKLSLDAAYAVAPPGKTRIAILPGNPTFPLVGAPYTGTVKGSLHMVSFGLTYRWDSGAKRIVSAKF